MDPVRFSKLHLRFPFSPSSTAVASYEELRVTNQTAVDLAFKVKTTNPSCYTVRPPVGVIPASSHVDIRIRPNTSPKFCRVNGRLSDKFLFCVTKAPDSAAKGLPEHYWDLHEFDCDVHRVKLDVEFAENEIDLVRLSKQALRFPLSPFSATITSSDELQVTNKSTVDLAFKVKTTNKSRYVVRPNVGVIPASQTLDILIGLHEVPNQSPGSSSEALVPGLSKDKFLLCVAKAPGTAVTGLPEDYWAKRETEPNIQGFKFKVEFVQHAKEDRNRLPTSPTPPQGILAHVPAPTPHAASPGNAIDAPKTNTSALASLQIRTSDAKSADSQERVQPISQPDADNLLGDRSYDIALPEPPSSPVVIDVPTSNKFAPL